ncbi:MAG: type II secretion system protein N [Gammaproteobacteria bacterium]
MPASRSPNRRASSPSRSANSSTRAALAPPRRSYWPWVLIGLAALLAVVIATLPASMITHFLPSAVRAEDFSGSFWHGSAGRISVDARPAGALEWRLHPTSLFGLAVAADLHWVKVGFVVDAAVKVDRQGFSAHDVKGGGPIEDLSDLGIAPGWRGNAAIDLRELHGDLSKPLVATGDIQVSNLTSPQFADGADLGGYVLRLAQDAVTADGNVVAQLSDTGGPLDLQAAIHYAAAERTATLSGSLRERPDAPATLRRQIDNLTQLHPRDPQGRVPVDFEFRF